MPKLLLCALCLLTLLIIPTLNTHAADRALLIGIDNYQAVNSLQGSKTDVLAMRDFIREVWDYPAETIRILTDADATRTNILQAFDDWLIAGSGPGDRVFFFYSGHGYYVPDQPGGDETEDGQDEVLVATDADLDETGAYRNMVIDDEINARLAQMQDRQVMVVVDSCHSGTITRGDLQPSPFVRSPFFLNRSQPVETMTRGDPRGLQRASSFVEPRSGLIAFSAVTAYQKALVDIEKHPRGGVFTSRFIEGIRDGRADADRDGNVVYAELLEYLREKSEGYCRRHRELCALGLTPQLEASAEVLAWDVRSNRPLPRPVVPAESLLAHDNDAGLVLQIGPRTRFRIGDPMQLFLTSQRAGKVLLFDLDAAGELVQILPNRYSHSDYNRIRASGSLLVPDDYAGFTYPLKEPTGQGRIIAVLIEDDELQTRDILVVGNDFEPITDPTHWLARLRERLNQILHQSDGSSRQARWSITWADYEVVQ